jgi:hypothetical protein
MGALLAPPSSLSHLHRSPVTHLLQTCVLHNNMCLTCSGTAFACWESCMLLSMRFEPSVRKNHSVGGVCVYTARGRPQLPRGCNVSSIVILNECNVPIISRPWRGLPVSLCFESGDATHALTHESVTICAMQSKISPYLIPISSVSCWKCCVARSCCLSAATVVSGPVHCSRGLC